MASAAAPKTKICVLLAILLVVGTATAVVHGSQDTADYGCVRRVGEMPPQGSCICYDRCARDGEGLKDAYSQTCFVDCVLRNGCVCPGDDVPAPGPLPATLDKTVRVNVTRPMVSRSREVKNEAEEMLVVAVAVRPPGTVRFDVYVDARHSWRFEATPEGEGPHTAEPRIPIGGLLDTIGADGDETVTVSLVPELGGDRVTVRSVRIEYRKKKLVDN